jgi:tight adherence protein C
MNVLFEGTCVAAGAGATMAPLLVQRLWRVRATLRPDGAKLPWPCSVACRAGANLAPHARRFVPAPLRAVLQTQLARAGLLAEIDAARWCAALLVLGVVGAGLGLASACAGWVPLWLCLPAAAAPGVVADSWLRGRARHLVARLLKELPSAIDVLVLCLESGAAVTTALRVTCEKSAEGPIRDQFAAILQQVRAGRPRIEAVRSVLAPLQLEAMTALMTALIQAETTGMSLGPVLRAQAAQSVADRFVRAERAAMQAPVRLLVPLLFCIFPCTFIIIAVPIAARLIGASSP